MYMHLSTYFNITIQTLHSNTTSSFLSNVHYHKADTVLGNMVLIGVNIYQSGAVKLEQYCII